MNIREIINTYQLTYKYTAPILDTPSKTEKRYAGKEQPIRTDVKIMRNDPCSCGSGKKYKKCCIGFSEPTKEKQYQVSEQNGGLKVSRVEVTVKGEYKGSCNRTACQTPDSAYYYNHSTEKYYCDTCADLINRVNHRDSMELYGHELCTYGKHKEI